MAKIDLNRFGGVRGTKLTPEELEGDAAVLTISEYAEFNPASAYCRACRSAEPSVAPRCPEVV